LIRVGRVANNPFTFALEMPRGAARRYLLFRRMSLSVSTRPLSLVPFLAADAVLLVTALLIAWRTPDALAGGALLGVVVCVVLGAVLAVLPFAALSWFLVERPALRLKPGARGAW